MKTLYLKAIINSQWGEQNKIQKLLKFTNKIFTKNKIQKKK